jgi:tetratricopeptide (TPR) repeat protein
MDAHCNLGKAFLSLGDLDSAEACYRKAIEIDPESSVAWQNLSVAGRFGPDDAATIEALQKLLASPTVTDGSRIPLHFALAKIYDDCQRFDEAFEHYQAANRLKHKTLNFDRKKSPLRVLVSNTISTYSADFFQQRIGYGSASEIPIFIVGMPRSGTTLVEQILAMHPLIFGAGELIYIANIATTLQKRLGASLPYPQCTKLIRESMANTLAREYLEQIRSVAGSAGRVTDKLPGNFMYLGLIALLFPRARVIHCQREALDVCLSIYFQNFLASDHAYAYDLADIAFQYRQYERLMGHWRKVLPLRIYDVQYEQLVADPEAGTRGLLGYCALPWDERCLRPYESKRPVYTASVWQVRQPIYKDSVHRWKRYEHHLGELKEALFGPNETDTRTAG